MVGCNRSYFPKTSLFIKSPYSIYSSWPRFLLFLFKQYYYYLFVPKSFRSGDSGKISTSWCPVFGKNLTFVEYYSYPQTVVSLLTASSFCCKPKTRYLIGERHFLYNRNLNTSSSARNFFSFLPLQVHFQALSEMNRNQTLYLQTLVFLCFHVLDFREIQHGRTIDWYIYTSASHACSLLFGYCVYFEYRERLYNNYLASHSLKENNILR